MKEQLKLFLPPVLYKIKDFLLKKNVQIIPSQLPYIEHNSEKIIIIGNGPSLNESVEKYKDEIVKCDRICVNYFASSDLYETLRPNIYVLADPAFQGFQRVLYAY